MCPCHVLPSVSAVIADHDLGISCFRFYLLFIEVNKHLSTFEQSHLYFYTVQTFIGVQICVQINLFSQLGFLSSPSPCQLVANYLVFNVAAALLAAVDE